MSDDDLDGFPDGWINFLARSPWAFRNSGSFRPFPTANDNVAITSHGLCIQLPILHNAFTGCDGATSLALLQCIPRQGSSFDGIYGIALNQTGHCIYLRSGDWKRPILFVTRSGPDDSYSSLSSLYMFLRGQWSHRVHMKRLRIADGPYWHSMKGEPALLQPEALSFHGQLFYRFGDEKWHVRGTSIIKDVGLGRAAVPPGPHRVVLCVSRDDLKPFINVAIHIRVVGDHAVVKECTMKLVGASGGDLAPLPPPDAGVEVASLPRQAGEIRFTPGDGPREVLVASWGIISISMSAFWKGSGEPPVVVASFACELPSPHEEHVRKAGMPWW